MNEPSVRNPAADAPVRAALPRLRGRREEARRRTRRAPALLRRALFVFGGWTLYAAAVAYLMHAWRARVGLEHVPYLGLLHFWIVASWLWAAFTLGIVALARRFPATRTTWPLRVPLHLVLALLVHVAYAVVLWAIHPYTRPGPAPEMPQSLFGTLFFDVFVYTALVAIVHAADAQGQAQRLRAELLEAELHVLRMQLQPHFLFNTLNAVSELIHVDPVRAERAVARLGDLLRWSLQSSTLREVSLREELTALGSYVEIQQLRHGEGLVVSVEAAPDTLDLAVPSLLLQPLLENAIRHGVRGRSAGRVEVCVRREAGQVRVTVSDDGAGPGGAVREGTGLRTTRARLAGLYGREQSLALQARSGGGTLVEITLPARPAVTEPAP